LSGYGRKFPKYITHFPFPFGVICSSLSRLLPPSLPPILPNQLFHFHSLQVLSSPPHTCHGYPRARIHGLVGKKIVDCVSCIIRPLRLSCLGCYSGAKTKDTRKRQCSEMPWLRPLSVTGPPSQAGWVGGRSMQCICLTCNEK